MTKKKENLIDHFWEISTSSEVNMELFKFSGYKNSIFFSLEDKNNISRVVNVFKLKSRLSFALL